MINGSLVQTRTPSWCCCCNWHGRPHLLGGYLGGAVALLREASNSAGNNLVNVHSFGGDGMTDDLVHGAIDLKPSTRPGKSMIYTRAAILIR